MTNSPQNRGLQRTIASVVRISGTGIHTGEACEVRLRPAADGTGRVILKDGFWIPVVCENVSDTNRCTTISRDGVVVHTVEHLLAALHALDIDNVLIETDGPEIPILDGSALPWMELIQVAGTIEQAAPCTVAAVSESFSFQVGASTVSIQPAQGGSGLTVTASVSFDAWPQGQASVSWCSTHQGAGGFLTDIAPARTWAFYAEVEQLKAAGLSKGASLDNALVITPPNEYSSELRLPQEWAKHKLLDLVGDLALVGARIEADVTVVRPGHKANNEAASAIRKTLSALEITHRKLNNEGK